MAFNTPALIARQADALQENFSDSFVHVVVDNSTLKDARREIRALCEDAGAEYVSLPPSHATTGSQSHGLALNWATTNVLRRSQSEYFGFLDHDIFPFAPCSYAEVLQEQSSYGHFQRAGEHRFYWPGLMFFTRKFLSQGTYDFQPRWLGRHYGDTGAGNCTSIYPKMDLDALRAMTINDFHAKDPSRSYVKTSTPLAFQTEAVTVLDDLWLHLINGSNWAADSGHAQKLDDLTDILRVWSGRRSNGD
ncbi:glycosyltransferase family A protein [Knoellia sp. CPCC 206453]|uniref:glycosyltransferase family A protein n=1 Tax=Knoellia pratensis TaxID=3404796 RepID=UPI0036105128